jgi:hypothetical protein
MRLTLKVCQKLVIYANDAFNLMVGFDVNATPQGSRNSVLLSANSPLWR